MRDRNTYRARVIELLPELSFKVEMEDGRSIRAYLSGKMRMNKIKVILADRVEIVLSPDELIGRVVKRL